MIVASSQKQVCADCLMPAGEGHQGGCPRSGWIDKEEAKMKIATSLLSTPEGLVSVQAERQVMARTGKDTSEYKLTRIVLLIAMVVMAVGGTVTSLSDSWTGPALTAIGGAMMTWATGAYAKARAITKARQ